MTNTTEIEGNIKTFNNYGKKRYWTKHENELKLQKKQREKTLARRKEEKCRNR